MKRKKSKPAKSTLPPEKPIFRTYKTKTPCDGCDHVRGNISPSPIYWSCAAESVMGVPFQDNGEGQVVFTETEDCEFFEPNKHDLSRIMGERMKTGNYP